MAKILVIDDDPHMRRMVRRALEGAGHSVVDYGDGRGGITHLAREAPDLLITDIFMPEMEGLETIRHVRGINAALPIIAMSGVSIEGGDYLDIAAKFGAFATLKKPFRPAELTELVAKLLVPATS